MSISRRFQILTTATAAFVVAVALASPAGAATRVGQSCTTGATSGPQLSFQSTVASGASYTAPTSGVVTRWGSRQTFTGTPPVYAKLAIGTGAVGSITLNSQGALQTLRQNVDEAFAERLPITAGQSIGINGWPASPICTGLDPAFNFAYYAGDPTLIAPGITFVPNTGAGVVVNVWADIEADVDADGFGDETQDKCPQSAAFQIACPVLSVGQQLSATGSAIKILGTASEDATLVATAKTKIGRKTVTFKTKATKFKAGKLKTLTLKLSAKVKAALKSGKNLKTTVTLSGNGVANTATATGRITLSK